MATLPPSLQAALDALSRGDVEPLAAQLHPKLEWRGVRRSHLWWAHTPS